MSSKKKKHNRKVKRDWMNDEKHPSSLAISLRWETKRSKTYDVWYFFDENKSESFSFLGKVWHLKWDVEKGGSACCLLLCLTFDGFPDNLSFSAKTTLLTKRNLLPPSMQFVQVAGVPKVIYQRNVAAQRESLARDDVWTVECQLSCGQPGVATIPVTILKTSSRLMPDYSLLFSAMFERVPRFDAPFQDLPSHSRNEFRPDVNLRCEDGTIMPAHRAILTFRSEVFADKFRNKMADCGTLDIVDLDADALRSFLEYLYSGKIADESVKTVKNLYIAAVQYGVLDLKKSCSGRIIDRLSRENCLEFLSLADAHGDRNLEDTVMNFIVHHPVVLETKDFTKFEDENPRLAVKIMKP